MGILLFVIGLVFTVFGVSAQDNGLERITDSIKNEGKMLYKSEMASWYGTDILTDKCKGIRKMVAGYISYDTGTGENNVFFSKGDDPKILATISFNYDFDVHNYKLDTVPRKLSKIEKVLYAIRQKAISEVVVNKDTLFKRFNNSSLNFIPVIFKNRKCVYILTGPEVSGIVLFGNDYLLTFDSDYNIIDKKRLHKNLIAVNYKKKKLTAEKQRYLQCTHIYLPPAIS